MNLLEKLIERSRDLTTASDHGAGIKDLAPLPPVSLVTIGNVESRLGFRLPQLMVDIYTKVANGGLGPGYGNFRVHDEPKTGDLVETYQYMKAGGGRWKWPDGLVPLFSHGCGVYECVDCTCAAGPMTWHDPGFVRRRSVPSSLAPLAPSLQQRLVAWINGEDLTANANEWLIQRRRS